MTKIDDPVAHWSATIADLEGRIAQQEAAVETAKDAAAELVLAGKDGQAAARDVMLHRDHLDSLKSALGAAHRHLRDAEETVAQRARAAALDRAQKLAKKRLDQAREIDEFLAALDPLVTAYLDTGAEMAREMASAGLRPPSNESLSGGYRLRAAFAHLAPLTATKTEQPRVNQDHRQSLRDVTAAQVRPLLRERISADG